MKRLQMLIAKIAHKPLRTTFFMIVLTLSSHLGSASYGYIDSGTECSITINRTENFGINDYEEIVGGNEIGGGDFTLRNFASTMITKIENCNDLSENEKILMETIRYECIKNATKCKYSEISKDKDNLLCAHILVKNSWRFYSHRSTNVESRLAFACLVIILSIDPTRKHCDPPQPNTPLIITSTLLALASLALITIALNAFCNRGRDQEDDENQYE